jgi:hypothetical protein
MAEQIGLATTAVLISSGTALSAAVPLGAKQLVGIAMPAAWDAAALTFQVSVDGGTTFFSIDDVWGHREFEQDARNRDRRRMWSEHRAALARLGVEQLQVGVVRKG